MIGWQEAVESTRRTTTIWRGRATSKKKGDHRLAAETQPGPAPSPRSRPSGSPAPRLGWPGSVDRTAASDSSVWARPYLRGSRKQT